MKRIGILLAALFISVLLMQFVWYSPPAQKAETVIAAEKVNLALRRTGHLILKQSGDSTSQIPPVKQIKKGVWELRLPQYFQYDSLPYFLQSSLNMHQINCKYDVAILKCSDTTLVKGYSFLDIDKGQKVPCTGREMEKGCYDIRFTILPEMKKEHTSMLFARIVSALSSVVLSVITILYFVGMYRNSRKNLSVSSDESTSVTAVSLKEEPESLDIPSKPVLQFANSRLDVSNLELKCGEKYHKLTYREAKLLHFFVRQANQVLERNIILENVWADEGIVVGRSIDMFVSRIRKMLKDDPNVQLVAVHGIGYKMEILNY